VAEAAKARAVRSETLGSETKADGTWMTAL